MDKDTFDVKDYLAEQISKPALDDNLDREYRFTTAGPSADIGVNSIMNMSANEFRLFMNPESAERKVYIVLDSRFADYINTERTLFRWNFITDNNLGPGTVNAIGSIRDIVQMRLFDYFIVSNSSNAWGDQMMQSVLVHEFQSQSFIAPENNRRFHFLGQVTTNNLIVQMPRYQVSLNYGADTAGLGEAFYRMQSNLNGVYCFQEPITTINTLSVSFASPYQLISVPKDTYNFTILTAAVPYIITLDTPLATIVDPDRCYISNFNTTDPVADAVLINMFNNPPDCIVWIATRIDPTTLSITAPSNIAAGTYTFPTMIGVVTTGTIFLDYYRFYLPIEITYKSEVNDR